jgi:methyl-accepting chemotaxis protein
MKLKRRMLLSYTIMTMITVAVGLIGIVSMLVLEEKRNQLLTGGASDAEIIAVSHQHIIYTSCAMLAFLAVGVIIALVLARRISRSVRLPIENILTVISQVGETGDLNFPDELRALIRKDGEYSDELGQLSHGFASMMQGIQNKVTVLEVAATGDLTQLAPAASENDTLANATNALIGNLNSMVREVRASVDQLSAGIAQISQGAQSLSQSTMEQTATMESLMDTLSEVSSQASDNAARSRDASDITSAMWSSAEDGRGSMDKMTQAMDEINAASQSISVVMKAIDDIAFQTNILSLNAAVEAARAGQHGRGFAVVADEVRNLARKSSSAADDTNELIADTMTKSKLGSNIVRDTSEYLNKIMNGVSENTGILKSIATATAEQNDSIDAIKIGFDQLSGVVHHNSATAEESAAATEQMRSQTDVLIELVRRFKIGDAAYTPEIGIVSAPAVDRDVSGDVADVAGDVTDVADVVDVVGDAAPAAGDAVAAAYAAAAEAAGRSADADAVADAVDSFAFATEMVSAPAAETVPAPESVPTAEPALASAPGEDEDKPWRDDESKY